MNKKVVILHNKIFDHSNPDEIDVLHQAELVSEAYKELGFEPIPMEVGFNPYDDILKVKKLNPEFVFNLIESVYDKGELLYIGPAILNTLHIPYTGNPLDALFVTTNKVLTKKNMKYHQISTPEFFEVFETAKLEKGKRYILKPIWEDGSVGLDEESVFTTAEKEKIERIKDLSPSHYFIEEFVEGREFNLSILGGKNKADVLQPAEMIFIDFPEGKPKMLGYKAKWDESSIEYKNTVRSFDTLKKSSSLYVSLKAISLKCWKSFNLKGYARVDFRVDANGNPFVIEINGNPCISPDSGFIAAANHTGYDNKTVVQRISEELN